MGWPGCFAWRAANPSRSALSALALRVEPLRPAKCGGRGPDGGLPIPICVLEIASEVSTGITSSHSLRIASEPAFAISCATVGSFSARRRIEVAKVLRLLATCDFRCSGFRLLLLPPLQELGIHALNMKPEILFLFRIELVVSCIREAHRPSNSFRSFPFLV